MPEPFDSASPPPQSPPPIRPTLEISSDDRMWAMMAHLAMFVFAIFGPLIIYLVKKEESSIRSSRRWKPTRASRIGIRIRFDWWISAAGEPWMMVPLDPLLKRTCRSERNLEFGERARLAARSRGKLSLFSLSNELKSIHEHYVRRFLRLPVVFFDVMVIAGV